METKTIILDYLKQQNAPILRKDLADMFHISQRILRGLLTELRQNGFPIMSNDDGISYTENLDVIEATERRMRATGLSNLVNAGHLRDIAKKIRDRQQIKIGGVA